MKKRFGAWGEQDPLINDPIKESAFMNRKIFLLLSVAFGCIAFITLGIKILTPDETIYVQDSKTGVKYKVSS